MGGRNEGFGGGGETAGGGGEEGGGRGEEEGGGGGEEGGRGGREEGGRCCCVLGISGEGEADEGRKRVCGGWRAEREGERDGWGDDEGGECGEGNDTR